MTTLTLVLVAGAAAAWYFQQQRRPGAGASAAAEARRLRTPLIRLADLLGIQTAAGQRARRFATGAIGEKATARLLRTLSRQGWVILHDLQLPTGKANVDHLAIAPSGRVFLIDSKLWTSEHDVHLRGTRLFHGTLDVDDRLDGLRHETRTVARLLGCPVHAVAAMHQAPVRRDGLSVGNIRIVPAAALCARLRASSRHADHFSTQAEIAARAVRLLRPYGSTGR
ncbi:nuclease-related domain-containing protein [Streptomyces microflavus]|uniref:nuclease-related domain-containing protein n=1 Tax=Streptomyces microflavus TaxID=1919 RepID=UPI0038064F4D